MKKIISSFISFILINVLILVITSPFVVLYGPFANIRSTVIGAVATSMHSNLLHYIMSDAQINKLLANAQGNNNSINEIISQFHNNHSNDIKITRISSSRFKGYLLEISDPTRLKVEATETLGQKGQTTSEIARQCGAVVAVNAGGFYDLNGTGNGREPDGVVIKNGCFLHGQDITKRMPVIGINNQGALISGRYTVSQIKKMHITEAVSFFPTLILNGQKQITHGDGGWGIAPRTAIGQKANGHLLLLVIDGRQPQYSLGATLVDIQNILYNNGAVVAANLDGGSSTTMYYKGKVINRPCDLLGERSIPTAFVII
ncbi:MAG TPA: phosphodiester glycosidase family protein [Syntrophomonadaceae bacterium]|nr:phosphodiester glycosidase family protein [Syntrophomonadaceae bacterium]